VEAKLGVLIIHGVGSHKPDFAEPMKDKLKRRISNHDGICWEPVHWADLLLKVESRLLKRLFPQEMRHHWFVKCSLRFKLRELVMNGIGDVTAYRSIPNISGHPPTRQTNKEYDEIHARVHKHIVRLRDQLGNAAKPLIVMAHSFGSVIMCDYIWDRQHNINKELYGATPFESMKTLAGLITFGSPIPLFAVADDQVLRIKLPRDTLQGDLKDNAKWLNFYDAHDVFGWPLTDLRPRVCEDRPIKVGSIFTRWNPACHTKYWTDNNFIEPVAQYISKILSVS
jgi:hypothetical protein